MNPKRRCADLILLEDLLLLISPVGSSNTAVGDTIVPGSKYVHSEIFHREKACTHEQNVPVN